VNGAYRITNKVKVTTFMQSNAAILQTDLRATNPRPISVIIS